MKKDRILLVSHIYSTKSGFVYGPVDVIEDYLNNKKRKYKLIKYSLVSNTPLLIKSLWETLNTIVVGIKSKADIFIGIDPLNALAGIILKKIHAIKKTIFYCVDYTPTRFKNKSVNYIYLWIDKYCALNSDEVWNVSTRIVALRKNQGVLRDKIKFVPNSPSFDACVRLPISKINRNQIIMVIGQTHSAIVDLVLKSFAEISKKIPNLRLKIIGAGKKRLQKNVEFLGQLENKKLLKIISKSGVALAIYTFSKDYSWIYYGDSKKTREYLASGVPVIITDIVGTSDDIKKYNAGIVIKAKKDDLVNAIDKLMSDKTFWKKSRNNAIKLGRDFDIDSILDRML